MIIAGLTGSIGMGKSTTAQLFKERGAAVFDADAAVHELYAKDGAAVPILRAGLPETVIDGAVDRQILSEKLRKDPLLLGVLESFIHPLVAQMREAAIEAARAAGKTVFINDMPVLFETGGETEVDIVIVVSAPADIQRQRVLSRSGMSAEKFAFILSKQMPDAEKRKRADYIVDSSQGLDLAREQVQTIMQSLEQGLNQKVTQ